MPDVFFVLIAAAGTEAQRKATWQCEPTPAEERCQPRQALSQALKIDRVILYRKINTFGAEHDDSKLR
ncbi:MAG: hypothetical protein ACRYGK_11120 [Janthinobacterium lividum]